MEEIQTENPSSVTELLLQVRKPLLMVLTPLLPKNYWWRDRCGILTLRSDNALMWNSDHLPSTTEISYKDFRQEASGGKSLIVDRIEGKILYCGKFKIEISAVERVITPLVARLENLSTLEKPDAIAAMR